MISVIFSRVVILLFGVLYPAYASYKTVRTKDLKKYVQWMMYWIVFALFTCVETFTDIFLSWFPFYYEVKVILVIWLLSPATKGSSMLYRRFVHPMLKRRETDIDDYLSQAKEKSYSTMLELGSKGVNYATSVIMQTAIKSVTNLGNARELVGRLHGDSVDFPQQSHERGLSQQKHASGVDDEDYNLSDATDGLRNKRSVSVDSGLRQRAAAAKKVMNSDGMQPAIFEEDEHEEVHSPILRRRPRVDVGAEGGDDGDGGKANATKAKKTTTKSASRMRGRAAIHN